MKHSLAERARLQAGYSLEAAARRLKLSPRYLRQIELHGSASLKLARRMGRLYNCSGNLFIHSAKYLAQLGQGTTGMSDASVAAGVGTRETNSRASRRYRPPKVPDPDKNMKSRNARRAGQLIGVRFK